MMPEDDIEELLKEMDADGDGEIDYQVNLSLFIGNLSVLANGKVLHSVLFTK